VLQEAIDQSYYDELIPIPESDGIAWSRRLAAEEGIFTGISGGSTFAVAVRLAEKAPEGSVFLVMLPDTGERYLSTPLFEGIEEDMTEEEQALSVSTPSAQLAAE
jgi:cysteine synthase A